MRSQVRRFIIVTALFFICAPPSMAQEMVKESSTKKMFLKEVTFSHDSTDYTVTLTGLTVRKKFVVKVYGIALIIDDLGIDVTQGPKDGQAWLFSSAEHFFADPFLSAIGSFGIGFLLVHNLSTMHCQ